MAQAATRRVTVYDIVHSREFAQGWSDWRAGLTLSHPKTPRREWRYERGRLAAAAIAARRGSIPPLYTPSPWDGTLAIPSALLNEILSAFVTGDVL